MPLPHTRLGGVAHQGMMAGYCWNKNVSSRAAATLRVSCGRCCSFLAWHDLRKLRVMMLTKPGTSVAARDRCTPPLSPQHSVNPSALRALSAACANVRTAVHGVWQVQDGKRQDRRQERHERLKVERAQLAQHRHGDEA